MGFPPQTRLSPHTLSPRYPATPLTPQTGIIQLQSRRNLGDQLGPPLPIFQGRTVRARDRKELCRPHGAPGPGGARLSLFTLSLLTETFLRPLSSPPRSFYSYLFSSPTYLEKEREWGRSQDRRVTGYGQRSGIGDQRAGRGRGERGRLGTGQGTQKRGRSTEMDKESWSLSHLSVYASAPWSLRPVPWGTVRVHRYCWAPSLGHHFRFFFSFASLASSASWSLLSFIIFLPIGVLKYQSWVRRRRRRVNALDLGLGLASRPRPLRGYGFSSQVSVLLEPRFLYSPQLLPATESATARQALLPALRPCVLSSHSHRTTLGLAADSERAAE